VNMIVPAVIIPSTPHKSTGPLAAAALVGGVRCWSPPFMDVSEWSSEQSAATGAATSAVGTDGVTAQLTERWVRQQLGPLNPSGWSILDLWQGTHRGGVKVSVVVGTAGTGMSTADGVGSPPKGVLCTTTILALLRAEPIGPGIWAAARAGHLTGFVAAGDGIDTSHGGPEQLRRLRVLVGAAKPGALTISTTKHRYVVLRVGARSVAAELSPTPAAWAAAVHWSNLVASRTGGESQEKRVKP
jgi:hypothetical protein